MDLTFEELVTAYFDCRRNKRKTLYATEFEFELEKNLFDLYEDLISGDYKIRRSVGFVVQQPKIREIWAATFRDRIVHHIIYNRLSPRFYPKFIRNSFACIPERGSQDASDRLWSGMRSITRNWNQPAYYLGADVRNFFVSIHKPTLFTFLRSEIHESWLLKLVEQVLFHDPRIDCVLKSKVQAFERVPRYKSLWHTPAEKGLPIGNLTSQFFANVYLDKLDQFVKHKLQAHYYYRYVDDIVILNKSPQFLNDCFEQISNFLTEQLKLELHPFKKRIGLLDQGLDFVGFIHRPYRRYIRERTANKAKSAVYQWKKNPQGLSKRNLLKFRATINSYFGLMRHAETYRLRKHLGTSVDSLFIRSDEHYSKLIVPDYSKKNRR